MRLHSALKKSKRTAGSPARTTKVRLRGQRETGGFLLNLSSGMYGQLNMLIKNIFNSAEESNFGGIFEGDFGTLRHRIFRWRVWHNLTKSEQLNTILMQALSNRVLFAMGKRFRH